MFKSFLRSQNTIPDFVLEGGHLLQSIVCPKPSTYHNICESYTSLVPNHYKTDATIVVYVYDWLVSSKSAEQNP